MTKEIYCLVCSEVLIHTSTDLCKSEQYHICPACESEYTIKQSSKERLEVIIDTTEY